MDVPPSVPASVPPSNRFFTGRLKKGLGRKKLSNISIYLGASLIKAIAFLAISPLISQHMSYYDFALVGFYTSFNPLFTPVLSSGFPSFYSSIFFKIEGCRRKKYAAILCRSQMIIGFTELLFILAGFSLYAKWQSIEFPVFPYALLSFGAIIFNNAFNFLVLVHKLKKEAKSFFLLSFFNVVVLVLSILLFVVVMKMGALGRILATLSGALVFGIIALLKFPYGNHFDTNILRDASKFCWPLVIAGSMEYFFTGVDRMMLLGMDDTVQLGLYNIAAIISGYLIIFRTSINYTFEPDLFKAVADNDRCKIFWLWTGITLLCALPVFAFVLAAPFVMTILTAGRYTEAYHYARVMALQTVTASAYFSLATIITAYGHTKITLLSKAAGTLISVAIFKYLINVYGFAGAAWGRVLSYGAMSLICLLFIIIGHLKTGKHTEITPLR